MGNILHPFIAVIALVVLGVAILIFLSRKRKELREFRMFEERRAQMADVYRIALARHKAIRADGRMRRQATDPLQDRFGVDVPTEFLRPAAQRERISKRTGQR